MLQPWRKPRVTAWLLYYARPQCYHADTLLRMREQAGPDIQVTAHYNLRRQPPVITGSLYPRNRMAEIGPGHDFSSLRSENCNLSLFPT